MSIKIKIETYESASEILSKTELKLHSVMEDIKYVYDNLDSQINSYIGRNFLNIKSNIDDTNYQCHETAISIKEKIEDFKSIEKRTKKSLQDIGTIGEALIGTATFYAVDSTSDTVVDHSLDKGIINNTDISSKTAAVITEAATAVGDFFSSIKNTLGEVVEDIQESISNTASKVVTSTKSAFDMVVDKAKEVRDFTWYSITHPVETLEKTGASIVNTAVGFVQGFGEFLESMVDTAAIIGTACATPFTLLADGVKGSSETKELWNKTMDFVSTKYVTNAFDSFHQNNAIGKWLDENAYSPFKSTGAVYKIADGAGYIGGTIALSLGTVNLLKSLGKVGGTFANNLLKLLTKIGPKTGTVNIGNVATISVTQQAVTSGVVATAAGFGKNTQNAWADGASLGAGLTYGTAMGLWEGTEMIIGAEINTLKFPGLSGLKGQLITTGSHVTLDTIDGGSAGIINPMMQMIYNPNEKNMAQIMYLVNYDENGNQINNKTWDELSFSEKYHAMFKYNGGWGAVGTQALSAGVMSFITEIPDIKAAIKPLTQEELLKQLLKIKEQYNIDLSSTKEIVDMLDGKIILTAKEIDDILQDRLLSQNFKAVSAEAIKEDNMPLEEYTLFENTQNEPLAKEKFIFDKSNENNFISTRYIDIEEFTKKTLEEQLIIVKTDNIYNLGDILKDERINKEVVEELERRLIKNQDLLFIELSKGGMGLTGLASHIGNNPDLLKELSDENIIRALANMSESLTTDSAIVKEIYSRASEGKVLFDVTPIEQNLFGSSIEDINLALNKLFKADSDLYNKLLENIKDKIMNNLSADIRGLNYGKFTQQLVVANMLEQGILDERGINILKLLSNQNTKSLATFDIKMLSNEMIDDFGEEFVLSIGPFSDMSSKLLSLKNNNPELFDIFSKIVKDSQIDNSLDTLYPKTKATLAFLFNNSEHLENMKNLDLDTIQEYILFYSDAKESFSNTTIGELYHSDKVKVNLSSDFYKDFYEACDKKFYGAISANTDSCLKEMKDAYFQKYFSMTYDEAKSLTIKYGEHISEIINNISSEETLKYIEIIDYINKIKNIDNIESLITLYENQNFRISSEEFLFIDDTLRREYTKTYEEALKKTVEKIRNSPSQYVDYNGKQVEIVQMEDFALLVYSSDTGFTMEKELINDSYITTWNQIADSKTHGLSTSFISPKNIGSAPVERQGVLYGFANINDDTIKGMGPYDINSNIANYGFSSGNQQIFMAPDSMSLNTTRVYNEFILNRSDVTPDYIVLYTDATESIRQNSLKAASEWNIPIVEIDVEKLAIKQAENINNLVDSFTLSGNISNLKEAIDLYESNISGYKLNINEEVEMLGDATANVNHQSVVNIFDSTKLETTILDYIDKIIKSKDSVKISELREILEEIQEKYNVSETKGTAIITHTKSGVDVATLLEILNEGE